MKKQLNRLSLDKMLRKEIGDKTMNIVNDNVDYGVYFKVYFPLHSKLRRFYEYKADLKHEASVH